VRRRGGARAGLRLLLGRLRFGPKGEVFHFSFLFFLFQSHFKNKFENHFKISLTYFEL
jgi:hypothetical protein